MTLKYNNAQHRLYLDFTDRIGGARLHLFEGDTEFYSAAFWDFLKFIWRSHRPGRKTDALGSMTALKSAHTPGKYLETALEKGLILETDNPLDARSKLLALSPEMRTKLDVFFDGVISELRKTCRHVDIEGPSPEDP